MIHRTKFLTPYFQKKILILSLWALCGTNIALADDDSHRNDPIRGSVFKWKDYCKQNGKEHRETSSGYSATPLHCGDVIRTNTKMTQDLDCSNTPGFALLIVGDGITLDGRGHKIIGPNAATAPNSAAGIFVEGANNTIRRVVVQGNNSLDPTVTVPSVRPYGIFGYNSPGLILADNDTSFNQVGIEIYTDSLLLNQLGITHNTSIGNAAYGIRTGQGGSGQIVNPIIQNNDFSQSQSFAIAIEATQYELGQNLAQNSFANSQNGIFLTGGTFYLHDFSLKNQNIQKAQIFGFDVASVEVDNVDVSTLIPAENLQDHTGIDLYRAGQFRFSHISSDNNDTGIRLETDRQVASHGSIENCRFTNNHHAGISIISYDPTHTQYGTIFLTHDQFFEGPGIGTYVLEAGTQADLQPTGIQILTSANGHRDDGSDRGDGHGDNSEDDSNGSGQH